MNQPKYKFKTIELYKAIGIAYHDTLYKRVPLLNLQLLKQGRDRYVYDTDVMTICEYYENNLEDPTKVIAFKNAFRNLDYDLAGVKPYQLSGHDMLAGLVEEDRTKVEGLVQSPKQELNGNSRTKVVSSHQISDARQTSTFLPEKKVVYNRTEAKEISEAFKEVGIEEKLPEKPFKTVRMASGQGGKAEIVKTNLVSSHQLRSTNSDTMLVEETNDELISSVVTTKPTKGEPTNDSDLVGSTKQPNLVSSDELKPATPTNNERSKVESEPTKQSEELSEFSLVGSVWRFVDKQVFTPTYLMFNDSGFRFLLVMAVVIWQSFHTADLFGEAGELTAGKYILGFGFEILAIIITLNYKDKFEGTIFLFSLFAFVVNFFYYDLPSDIWVDKGMIISWVLVFKKLLVCFIQSFALFHLTKLFTKDFKSK